MSFTKLADPCETCPNAETCDHKQMVALAELPGKPIDISPETCDKLEEFKRYVTELVSKEFGIPIEVLDAQPPPPPYLYIEPIAQSAQAPYVAPVLRETVPVNINGKLDKMYKDELDAMLYGHLYADLCITPSKQLNKK